MSYWNDDRLMAGAAGAGYVLEEVVSLPNMASNTLPSGHVVSTGGTIGGAAPYLLFVVGNANVFQFYVNGTGPWWVQRKVPSPIRIWKYRIRGGSTAARQIRRWRIEASNDGVNFDTIEDHTDEPAWGTLQGPRDYELSAVTEPYSYWRLAYVGNFGDSLRCDIREWQLLQAI